MEQIIRSAVAGTATTPAANRQESVSSATNRFSTLHIEESADNDEDQADIFLPEPAQAATAPSATGSKATFVPEVSRDDAIWAILDFFTDVIRVRNYVRELWTAYTTGEVDLITVSVTTNTALELLRDPHDDLRQTMIPVITDEIPHLQLILYNFLAALNGRPIIAPLPLFTQVDDSDDLLTSLYDYLLVPNCQIIMGFAKVITSETLPFYKPGHYGKYDPTFGSGTANGLDTGRNFSGRWKSSMVLLCETFVEYLYLLDFGQKVVPPSPALFDEPVEGPVDANMFYIDEIACEMESFRRKTKQISLLLLVYSQIFLDINIVLGSEAARGHKEMKKALSGMRTSLSQRKSTESPIPPETWPKENEQMMEALREEIEFWFKSDPVEVSKKVARKSFAVSENTFMQRSPMLCGLVLFRIRLQYQHLSLALANAWAIIASTAHLYLACRLYDKHPRQKPFGTWPDMDLVLDLHGKDDICGGLKVEKVEDALAAHLKMMGYDEDVCKSIRAGVAGSELLISRHRRKALSTKISNGGPVKGLVDHTQIIPIFRQRYLADSAFRTKLDIKAIQTLLSDLDRDAGSSNQPNQEVTGGRNVRGVGKKKKQLRRTRKHKSPKFSIVQLLAIIEAGLDTETTALRFDYVAMHLRCIRVLKKVQATAHDYLVKKHGTGYLENDSQLPYIVAWILIIASMAERTARSAGITSFGADGTAVGSRLLMGAVGALNEWLADKKEARAEVDRVGHLPYPRD